MPTDKFKNQLQLHFIVFIWGFTAILAALISVNAMTLVWYRVLIASMTILVFLKIKKVAFNESKADVFKLFIGGILIALHWTTFFHAIKISTISTTLITMSSGALFVVMLQPILGEKKFSFFEDETDFMDRAASTPRSNCVLDTTKAEKAGLGMRPVEDAVRDALRKMKQECLV